MPRTFRIICFTLEDYVLTFISLSDITLENSPVLGFPDINVLFNVILLKIVIVNWCVPGSCCTYLKSVLIQNFPQITYCKVTCILAVLTATFDK